MEITQVHFCDVAGQERHRARLGALIGPAEKRIPQIAPATHPGERWQVVAEWDASHAVPKRGDGKGINPPGLVAWSPNGDRMFTSSDAWGLACWTPSGEKIGSVGHDTDYGRSGPAFISQLGSSCMILRESYTSQCNYIMLHNDRTEIMAESQQGLYKWAYPSMNREFPVSPWRPGSEWELAILQDRDVIAVLDVSGLNSPWLKSAPLLKSFDAENVSS
jgi:hypothetical protein